MPLLPRDPGAAGKSTSGTSVSKSYAIVILAALVLLIAMRHLFGSVHAEGGVR
jgi:hypothetical protein